MKIAGLTLPALRPSEALRSAGLGLCVGAIVAALTYPLWHRPAHPGGGPIASIVAAAQAPAPIPVPQIPRIADFGSTTPSPEARFVADWVADSRDNRGLPFVIVDKAQAHVFVFDADGRMSASTPILLGASPGDDSVPGIGQKAIEDIPVEERTTPAGRFMGQRGMNARNEDVVWVDYGAAVSMHRVVTNVPEERRQQRLDSPTITDNRISWGCINIPVAFFERQLAPLFAERKAPVYVLPEVKTIAQVFPTSYDVAKRHAEAGVPLAGG